MKINVNVVKSHFVQKNSEKALPKLKQLTIDTQLEEKGFYKAGDEFVKVIFPR